MLCVLAYIAGYFYVTRKIFRCPEEYWDGLEMLFVANENRESELLVVHNDEVIDGVTFEDR
jgi:hypothetical protein